MTELEIATEKVRLIYKAIDSVKDCAKQAQQISHDKHIEEHYTTALYHLDICRTRTEILLTRIKLIGK